MIRSWECVIHDTYEEGYEQGVEEVKVTIIRNMYELGYKAWEIADIVEKSVSEIAGYTMAVYAVQ